MKVAAMLVSYEKILDLDKIANDLLHLVDLVYIGDISPQKKIHICEGKYEKLIIKNNFNQGGLAGAYNMGIQEALNLNKDISHFLFLDDDTNLKSIGNFLKDQKTSELLSHKRVAAVAPKQRDASTGMLSTYIELKKWHYIHRSRNDTTYSYVSFIINSMSLWKTGALKEIGEYSTELFLDHVDTDFCLRSKQKGYLLGINHNVEFLHTIGNRKLYKFLGMNLQATGHNPFRREMIIKNTVILIKKYSVLYPAFFLIGIIRIFYEVLGIIIAENDKKIKLISISKGFFKGLRN